jgi:hypothetical protein
MLIVIVLLLYSLFNDIALFFTFVYLYVGEWVSSRSILLLLILYRREARETIFIIMVDNVLLCYFFVNYLKQFALASLSYSYSSTCNRMHLKSHNETL